MLISGWDIASSVATLVIALFALVGSIYATIEIFSTRKRDKNRTVTEIMALMNNVEQRSWYRMIQLHFADLERVEEEEAAIVLSRFRSGNQNFDDLCLNNVIVIPGDP